MRIRRFASALLPLLMLSVQPTVGRAQDIQTVTLSSAQQATYAHAVLSFREQRYAAAYGRFAELADAGHVPAAELALLMYRYGRTLFANDWSATADQQRRWNALVINSARNRINFADNRGD